MNQNPGQTELVYIADKHCLCSLYQQYTAAGSWFAAQEHAVVLRSAFQTSPLDLSTPGFYTSRQAMIEARLADVAASGAPALLRAAWSAYKGVMCVGVNWERHGACGCLCCQWMHSLLTGRPPDVVSCTDSC